MTRPVIIGGGMAGLACALSMAPKPVVVLAGAPGADTTSSSLAQGGLAAAVGEDDSTEFHLRDTLVAGAGLCEESVARVLIESAPQTVQTLESWGVRFDRNARGALALGLEAAHSHRRIVHAQGAATGAAIMRVLREKARQTPSIMMIEDAEATKLMLQDGAICGVVFRQSFSKRTGSIASDQVILASGSACALWRRTTVPGTSWGQGIALAARAGATLRDMEFVQFHPTALDSAKTPLPLLSEALRGEGALLVTDKGERFVDELAPRDVVARAVWSEQQAGRRVFLDARTLTNFAEKFPALAQICFDAGLDPSTTLLPITPVAHYHMGGIATDANGRTTVQGLWACGECACTGLHGANRLASSSLLEAFVMGARVSKDVEERSSRVIIRDVFEQTAFSSDLGEETAVRTIMNDYLGLVREERSMTEGLEKLTRLSCESAFIARMIAHAALARKESRGAHFRNDYATQDSDQKRSLFLTARNNAIVLGEHHAFSADSRHSDRTFGARRTA